MPARSSGARRCRSAIAGGRSRPGRRRSRECRPSARSSWRATRLDRTTTRSIAGEDASARALPSVAARTVQKLLGLRCLAFAQNAAPRRTDRSATRGSTIFRKPNRLTSPLSRRRCFALKCRLSTRSAFTRPRALRASRSLSVPRFARSTPTAQSCGAALARRPESFRAWAADRPRMPTSTTKSSTQRRNRARPTALNGPRPLLHQAARPWASCCRRCRVSGSSSRRRD